MIYNDINIYLATLFYPITSTELLYDDPLQQFFEYAKIIEEKKKIEPSYHFKDIMDNRERYRKKIRSQVISFLSKRYHIPSYDYVYQYMEKWYLGSKIQRDFIKNTYREQEVSSLDYYLYQLNRISESMISILDQNVIYKYWENEHDKELLGGFSKESKIHLYRTLNQTIPCDILVVIFAIKNRNPKEILENFYGYIAITDQVLEPILQKGVAENHLHLGVGQHFFIAWDTYMNDLFYDVNLFEWVKKFSEMYGITGDEIVFDLCLAYYIRKIILMIIWYSQDDIEEKLYELEKNLGELELKPRDIIYGNDLKQKRDQFLMDKNDTSKKIKDYFKNLHEKLNELLPDNVKRYIGITFAENKMEQKGLMESFFLYDVLKFIERDSNAISIQYTACVKKLFLQYLRLKNTIFQVLVQVKNVSGLDRFQQYYGNSSGFHKGIQQDGERLLRSLFSIRHLNKIELRTSFPSSLQSGKKTLRKILKAYRDLLQEQYCQQEGNQYEPIRPFPRIGLVYHFLKQDLGDRIECVENRMGLYQSLYEKYKIQLDIFKEIRSDETLKGIDKYLVGIDVASLENVVPTWVFTEIYENARDAKGEYMNEQSLGFTCHAGEDFRHLLSGIRRIYEVITYLKFHAGDRIGHALALGQNIEQWLQKNPNVILPRIEAIENYVWAYKLLSTHQNDLKFSCFEYLEYRILELSQEIYPIETHMKNIAVKEWLNAYELLFKKRKLNKKRRKNERKVCPYFLTYYGLQDSDEVCFEQENCNCDTSYGAHQIYELYHCSLYNDKMKEPIHYQIQEQEYEVMKAVQKIVQDIVAKEGIIVEANPNSNVSIGDIDTLKEHPMYVISKPECDYRNIMVCINSDDPCVFHTNAVNELGFSYFSLIDKGVGREECIKWIEKIRGIGYTYSFIRRRDTDKEILQELDRLIQAL